MRLKEYSSILFSDLKSKEEEENGPTTIVG
jgi:hypothetical protein